MECLRNKKKNILLPLLENLRFNYLLKEIQNVAAQDLLISHNHTLCIQFQIVWNINQSKMRKLILKSKILSRLNLKRSNLTKLNLMRSNLRRSNLRRSNLKKQYLKKSNLRRSNQKKNQYLKRPNLVRSNLRRLELMKSNLKRLDFFTEVIMVWFYSNI